MWEEKDEGGPREMGAEAVPSQRGGVSAIAARGREQGPQADALQPDPGSTTRCLRGLGDITLPPCP